ncbi:MAG: CidA/LrgA family protein [Bacteroidetes bacterium]|nr:CidA/LrgA family protein [Bacteroidota bacterium]
MRNLKQIVISIFDILRGSTIILFCYYFGKLLSNYTHGLLSGSVIGMIILFTALTLGLIKKEHVKTVAQFLINNLIVFFVPALVGATLINFTDISSSILDIAIIAIFSTIMVMTSTGLFVQWREKKEAKKNE